MGVKAVAVVRKRRVRRVRIMVAVFLCVLTFCVRALASIFCCATKVTQDHHIRQRAKLTVSFHTPFRWMIPT
eukprot:scaffold92217_cov68-Cyclotella_meneghiniana.AAC.4